MTEPVTVARTGDLAPGQGAVVEVGRREIAVFNADGTFYAVENTCCHRGGPLGQGTLDGTVVECPWHMWRFALDTGACLNSPGDRIRTYEVLVQGDEIKIRL